MKIRKALEQYNLQQFNTKFMRSLYTLLLAHGDEKYSGEVFDAYFDQAIKKGKCELDNRKGFFLYNNGLYCRKHKKNFKEVENRNGNYPASHKEF